MTHSWYCTARREGKQKTSSITSVTHAPTSPKGYSHPQGNPLLHRMKQPINQLQLNYSCTGHREKLRKAISMFSTKSNIVHSGSAESYIADPAFRIYPIEHGPDPPGALLANRIHANVPKPLTHQILTGSILLPTRAPSWIRHQGGQYILPDRIPTIIRGRPALHRDPYYSTGRTGTGSSYL